MKKLNLLLAVSVTLLLAYAIFTRTTAGLVKSNDKTKQLQSQLINYASYPEVLQQIDGKGTVLIRFQVTADNRIAGVQTNSSNPQLKASLEKQLIGKKLLGDPKSYQNEYLVRMRFQSKAS